MDLLQNMITNMSSLATHNDSFLGLAGFMQTFLDGNSDMVDYLLNNDSCDDVKSYIDFSELVTTKIIPVLASLGIIGN